MMLNGTAGKQIGVHDTNVKKLLPDALFSLYVTKRLKSTLMCWIETATTSQIPIYTEDRI